MISANNFNILLSEYWIIWNFCLWRIFFGWCQKSLSSK